MAVGGDPITEREAVEAIPRVSRSFIWQYVSNALERTDAPALYQVGTAYSLLAATAPGNLVLPGLAGGEVPPNLYVMLVGQSGSDRKTTAIAGGRDMLAYAAPDVVTEDPASAEAFVEGLCNQPIQLYVLEEMGEFWSSTQGATNYLQKLKGTLTRVFDGGPLSKSYAGGKRKHQTSYTRLSILGGVTPVHLERHTEPQDWTGGLLSRFFTCYAIREREQFVDRSNPEVTSWLRAWLHHAATQLSAPPCTGLDEPALDFWVAWNKSLQAEVSDNTRVNKARLAGQIARTPLMALKIALLNGWDRAHTEGYTEPWMVTMDHLAPAVKLAELHYKSVVGLAHLASSARDVRDRRAVIEALQDREWAPVGEVLQRVPEIGLQRRALEILATLTAEQVVVVGNFGGTEFWRLAPEEERQRRIAAVRENAGLPDQSAIQEQDPLNPELVETEDGRGQVVQFPATTRGAD